MTALPCQQGKNVGQWHDMLTGTPNNFHSNNQFTKYSIFHFDEKNKALITKCKSVHIWNKNVFFCQLLCFWQASQPVSFRDNTIGAKQSNSNKANQDRAEAVSFFFVLCIAETAVCILGDVNNTIVNHSFHPIDFAL